jgi:hypothetical protein
MPSYIAERELRIGPVTYARGAALGDHVVESLPERTRKALVRLGWISESKQDEAKMPAKGTLPTKKRGEI